MKRLHFPLIGLVLLLNLCFFLMSCGQTENNSGVDSTARINDSVMFSDSTVQLHAFDTATQIGLNIRGIFEDRAGNMWFAIDANGVCKYDPNAGPDLAFRYFYEEDGLISNHAGFFREDNDGDLWIATAYGICRYDGERFTSFTDKQGQPVNPDTEQIAQSQALYFWIGANSGAYRSDGKSLQFFPMPLKSGDPFVTAKYPATPNSYTVYATLTDQHGDFWFATTGMGIGRYNGKTFQYYREIAQIDGVPRCIFEDSKGKIWVGSNGGGVSYYTGNTWVNFNAEQKFGDDMSTSNMEDPLRKLNRVWSITEDHQGNIWFATFDEGVWKYDPVAGKMTNYTMNDGLTSNSVWTLFCDRAGKLWIGTDGGGVCTYDGVRFENFTRNAGLNK